MATITVLIPVGERRQAPALPAAQARPGHERVHVQIKTRTEHIEVSVGAADLANDLQPPGHACGHVDVPADREGFSVDILVADHDVPDGHFEFRSRLLPSRWKCEAECHADNGPKTGKPAESLKHVHLVIRIGGLAKNRSAAPKGVSLSRPVARHEPLPASWNDPAATGTNSQS